MSRDSELVVDEPPKPIEITNKNNENIVNDDEISQSLRDRVYHSAKNGHSLELIECLKPIKSENKKNLLINEVSVAYFS